MLFHSARADKIKSKPHAFSARVYLHQVSQPDLCRHAGPRALLPSCGGSGRGMRTGQPPGSGTRGCCRQHQRAPEPAHPSPSPARGVTAGATGHPLPCASSPRPLYLAGTKPGSSASQLSTGPLNSKKDQNTTEPLLLHQLTPCLYRLL